jgi:uncharacterized membrane protein YphA (DoxX/SURF4 family)
VEKIFHAISNLGIALLIAISIPTLVHLGGNIIMKQPAHPFRSDYPTESRTNSRYDDSTEYIQAKKTYEVEYKSWSNKYFYVSLISALICVVLGMFLTISSLSLGFIFAAIFTAISGYIQTWIYVQALPKFIALLIMLALLIICVIFQHHKKNPPQKKKKAITRKKKAPAKKKK